MNNLAKFALAAAFGIAPSIALADVVGNVGAVNQAAKGIPPGAGAHMLSLGGGVVDKERIETGADGKAQIVFTDKSTMSVGAGSSVTINHFVYDGHRGAGKQSVSIAKGALRFIGGSVSHEQGAGIKTPQASITVRGGMVEVTVGHACPSGGGSCEEIVLLNGVASITTPAGTTELTRPGYSVTIDEEGHVSDPAPVSSSTLDDLESAFKSLPGQTAGAAPGSLPTDTKLQTALGDFHLPEHAPWGGLGAIGAHWAGKGVAQSHAQTINQATAAKTTQTTAALVAAAQNQTHSTCSSSGGTAPPPTGGPGASSSGSTGIFSKGFCVWGCVTPTYVSSTTPTNESGSFSVTYKADFSSSGHGYFLITVSTTASSWTGTSTSTSTVRARSFWSVSTV